MINLLVKVPFPLEMSGVALVFARRNFDQTFREYTSLELQKMRCGEKKALLDKAAVALG